MSLVRKAVKGSLWMAVLNYSNYGLLFLCNIVLARLLTPDDFGVMALALSMADIVFMLAGFGFSMACIQLQELDDVFETGLTLTLVAGLTIFLVGLVAAWGASWSYPAPVATFLAVLSVMAGLKVPTTVFMARIEKDFAFATSALVRFLTAILGMGLGLTLAYLGWGAWSLLAREVAATVALFAGAVLLSPLRFRPRFNPATARRLLRFCFGMLGMRISEVFYNKGFNLAMGTLAGTSVFGLYDRAHYVATFPNTAMAQFHAKVTFTILSRIKNDLARSGEAADVVLWLLARLTLPVGLMVFIFPGEIITLILGGQWLEAAGMFRGLALFMVVQPLYSSTKHILLSQGAPRSVTISRVAALGVVLSMVFAVRALRADWAWAAWGVSLANLVSLLILVAALRSRGVIIHWRRILATPCVLCVALGMAVVLARGHTHYLVCIALSALAWCLASAVLEREQYLGLWSRLRGKSGAPAAPRDGEAQ